MKNYIQAGERLTFTAGGAIASGSFNEVGGIVGVAVSTYASGDSGELAVEGVFDGPCVSGDNIAQGDQLWWNGTNLTKTASGNQRAGTAWTAAGVGVTTVHVKLEGRAFAAGA